MCHPAVGYAVMFASTALSVFGQLQGMQNAKAQADSAASMQEFSAVLAERQARQAKLEGLAERQKIARLGTQLKGQQRAEFASSGVVLDQDSPLDVLEDTAATVAFDELEAIYKADMRAWNYRRQADADRMAAEPYRLKARQAAFDRDMWVASTAIDTLGKMFPPPSLKE